MDRPNVDGLRIRPRRSALYLPGSNARALEKAQTLPADVLILDLEDSVAPDAKDDARRQLFAAIAEAGYAPREVIIRVNGLDTPWGEADLAAVSRSNVDGVLLPKVDGPADLIAAEENLRANSAPETLVLWCMMETPKGILGVEQITGASPRLAGLVMGLSDLGKDLRAVHTPDRVPFHTSLQLCVLSARAAGIAILDGVHLDLQDDAGFTAVCRQGREFGFDGKTLIHPKQLAAANDAFAPNVQEIGEAEEIIAAHAEAIKAGKGVTVLNGRLVENLHVAQAERLLALAAAIKAFDSAMAV